MRVVRLVLERRLSEPLAQRSIRWLILSASILLWQIPDTRCTDALQHVVDHGKSFSAAIGPSSYWAWPTSTYCPNGSKEQLRGPSGFARHTLETGGKSLFVSSCVINRVVSERRRYCLRMRLLP